MTNRIIRWGSCLSRDHQTKIIFALDNTVFTSSRWNINFIQMMIILILLSIIASSWQIWLPYSVIFPGILIVFIFRLLPKVAQYGPWAAVFSAALTLLLPGGIAGNLAPFFIALALFYLIGVTIDGYKQGSLWYWLAPLVLFLANPTSYSLISSLVFVFFAALNSTTSNEKNILSPETNVRGLFVILTVAISVFLISLLLKPASDLQINESKVSPQKVTPKEKPQIREFVTTKTTKTKQIPQRNKSAQSESPNLLISFNLLLLLFTAVILVFVLRSMVKTRFLQNRRLNIVDLIPIIGGFILVIVLFVLGFSAYKPSHATKYSNSADNNQSVNKSIEGKNQNEAKQEINKITNDKTSVIFITIGSILLSLGAIIYFIVLSRSKKQKIDDISESFEEKQTLFVYNPPDNRVRLAYLNFLKLANQAGLPRLENETAKIFAKRFSSSFNNVKEAVFELTDIYEPIRYGKEISETNADQAEKLLEKIKSGLTA